MSYKHGEELVLDTLRMVAGGVWGPDNSSRGKWGILNSGKSDHYAIVKPGSFTNAFTAMAASTVTWTTLIEVWVKYTEDGDTLERLEDLSEALIVQFNNNPHLGDQFDHVLDSSITGGSPVDERWRKGADGPAWLRQTFTVTWMEELNADFA